MSNELTENFQHSSEVTVSLPPGGSDMLGREKGFVIGARGQGLMRFETDKHMVTIANTGGGKGRAVAIPNLLTHEGSVLSVEIGGATYKATVDYRRHVLKQKIVLIDPFGATGDASDSFNVLDALNVNESTFANDVLLLAQSLIKEPSGKQEDSPYFRITPPIILQALIIYVKTSPDVEDENRNMAYVAKLVGTYPGTDRDSEWPRLMDALRLDTGKYASLLNPVGNYFATSSFDVKPNKNDNLDSLISSISFPLAYARTPPTSDLIAKSSFSLKDLRDGKTTIYVVMPSAEYFTTSASLMRSLLDMAFLKTPNSGNGGKGYAHDDRILFMLDEFTQLGKLDSVDMGMQTARQKGITIWAMFQSIGRLESLYGKEIADSFLGAAGVVQLFDIGDEGTKKYASERAGMQVAYIPSVQEGTNSSESKQHGTSSGEATGTNESLSSGTQKNRNDSWGKPEKEGKEPTAAEKQYKETWSKQSFDYKKRPAEKRFDYSTSDGTTSGKTHGTSTQTSSQTSETFGEQTGKSYSVTYTPHIIPKMNPSEIEQRLGGDNRQLIFTRGREGARAFMDFRANHDEIHFLKRRVGGPDNITLPVPEPMAYLPGKNPLADFNIMPFIYDGADMVYLKSLQETVQRPPMNAKTQFEADGKYKSKWYIEIFSLYENLFRPSMYAKAGHEVEIMRKAGMQAETNAKGESIALKQFLDENRDQVANGKSGLWLAQHDLQDEHTRMAEYANMLNGKAKELLEADEYLNQFQFRLNDEYQDENRLRAEMAHYGVLLDGLLELKKEWVAMTLPGRPSLKSTPFKAGDDTALQKELARNSSLVLSACVAPRSYGYTPPASIAAIPDLTVKGLKREFFTACEKYYNGKKYNDEWTFSRLDPMNEKYKSNVIFKFGELHIKALHEYWREASDELKKELTAMEGKVEKYCSDLEGYRREHNQSLEKLISYDRHLMKTGEQFESFRADLIRKASALSARFDRLTEAGQTLEARRSGIFNEFRGWGIWDRVEAAASGQKMVADNAVPTNDLLDKGNTSSGDFMNATQGTPVPRSAKTEDVKVTVGYKWDFK